MGKADTQSAEGPASGTTAAVAAKKGRGFRICSAAVLLTYSGKAEKISHREEKKTHERGKREEERGKSQKQRQMVN